MLSRLFLLVKDVADLLKVGETAGRSWIKHGNLRCHCNRAGMAGGTEGS